MDFEREDEITHWQEIRANWINGEQKDAVSKLNFCSHKQLREILLEMATRAYMVPKGCISGDLKDAIEILAQSLKT